MPPVADQAVVLRHWDYSETSQTIALLTRDHGIIRGLAKGARREKGSFSGGFELLTRGEILFIVRPSSELALLTEWDLQEVYWAARRDLRAHHIGLYMIDLVHHLLTTQDPHPTLFDTLAEALSSLDDPDRHDQALLTFQWALLVETGYQPSLGGPDVNRTVGFNARAGEVVDDPGANVVSTYLWRVRGETIRLLQGIAGGDDSLGVHQATTVDRANRLLASYTRVLMDRDLPTRAMLFGK